MSPLGLGNYEDSTPMAIGKYPVVFCYHFHMKEQHKVEQK